MQEEFLRTYGKIFPTDKCNLKQFGSKSYDFSFLIPNSLHWTEFDQKENINITILN